MIIRRYLLREIAVTFLGVGVLLSLIFMSSTFVRILAEAAAGTYPAAIVLKLFALKAVGNVVFILPLAFFIAVLLALGRFYRDSEMAVLAACGVGPGRIYNAIGVMAVAVAVVLGWMSLQLTPWAEGRSYQLLDEASAKSDLEGLAAGRFNKVGAGGQLVYVQNVSQDHKQLGDVFATATVDGRREVLSARSAYQETDHNTGQRYLVLVDGYRYEGSPGQADYKVAAFKFHGIRMVQREVVPSARPRYAVPTATLWRSNQPQDVAELQWRAVVPFTTILLALFAVPLSRSSPRAGRYSRLFFGILVYIGYSNLLVMAKSNLAKGIADPRIGLWWVPLLLLAALLALAWWQNRLRGLRRSAS